MDLFSYPIKIKGARVWRPFTGGRELDRLHGIEPGSDGFLSEEWILSVTKAVNVGREHIEEGLCYLADSPQVSLEQLIKKDPVRALGRSHVAKYGSSLGVLTKLIDSAVRLPLQVHPDKKNALKLFNSQFGKTESWHILSARGIDGEPACLYIGFKPGVKREDWVDCFGQQDIPRMLSMLHKVEAVAGDTYIIRGGIPHAIGAGCFLVEILEPTDLTIRIERVTPSGAVLENNAIHQGLGYERMFDVFDFTPMQYEQVVSAFRVKGITRTFDGATATTLVGYGTTDCFSLESITVAKEITLEATDGFFGLFVYSGSGVIRCGEKTTPFGAMDQYFCSAGCEKFTIVNNSEQPAVIFRIAGPKPE